jgi:hypothetical protein
VQEASGILLGDNMTRWDLRLARFRRNSVAGGSQLMY